MSEPQRGRRKWGGRRRQREAVYGNRRRIAGERGKRLLRLRGELLERTFAHCYETGGMRRAHLRGRENVLKRLLIHVGACNLSLAMRRKPGGHAAGDGGGEKGGGGAGDCVLGGGGAVVRGADSRFRAAAGEDARFSRRPYDTADAACRLKTAASATDC